MACNERSAGFIVYRPVPQAAFPTEPAYLLLDYGRHWDFPKGHVEAGEDDMSAARRELHEETGITEIVLTPDFREEIVYFFRHAKRGLIRKTVVFFLGETQTHSVVLSHEHAGYEFLPFPGAMKRVTFPTARSVLRAAHDHLIRAGVASPCSDETSRPSRRADAPDRP